MVSKAAVARARTLRKSLTLGEARLWSELREYRKLYGIHARKQAPLGPYVADFVIHSHKLVIEVDGESHFEPVQQERDARRDKWMGDRGYRVVRFSTGELDEALDGCIEEILRELGVR